MKVICTDCKKGTIHKILKEEIYKLNEPDDHWWEEHQYQIIQCQGCETISFRKLYTDISQCDTGGYLNEDPWTETLYPKRSLHTLSIRNFLNTPQNIIDIYRETIDTYNNKQTILCSGGLRAIIEGICKNLGIESGEVENEKGIKRLAKGLDGKIEGLAAKGLLTKGHAQFLHELRFLGNSALHELSSPPLKDLKLAIEIVEHTLDNIYELSHKAARLKAGTAKIKKQMNN